MRFDGVPLEAVEAVASLFGTAAQRQAFELPDDDLGVWEVMHRAESGNVRLLLWPAIARVDVAVGPHMWVVKGVRELEVIEDLELIARFGKNSGENGGEGGVLTVSLGGTVVLSSPSA